MDSGSWDDRKVRTLSSRGNRIISRSFCAGSGKTRALMASSRVVPVGGQVD
jgi:hypothetical protein